MELYTASWEAEPGHPASKGRLEKAREEVKLCFKDSVSFSS